MAAHKHNKGLGRGINALFPDSQNFEKKTNEKSVDEKSKYDQTHAAIDATIEKENLVAGEQVQAIKLDEIRPNPYQPRTHFNEEALQELADSIKEKGVFQPVILRKSAIKGYEIIAGERRIRASKLAGQTTVPAIIRQMNDTDMIETAIIENLQREDLTPLEEAQAYENLMTSLNLTQAEVAKRVGKSRTYIANFVRLLTLNDDVKEFVQNGELSMGQARTLLGLKNKKDQLKLAQKVINEGMTVRHLEKLVQALNEPVKPVKSEKAVKPEKTGYIRESEDRLMDKFGTTVQIQDKGERGKIEIEYLSQDDLTRILDILEIRLED